LLLRMLALLTYATLCPAISALDSAAVRAIARFDVRLVSRVLIPASDAVPHERFHGSLGRAIIARTSAACSLLAADASAAAVDAAADADAAHAAHADADADAAHAAAAAAAALT